MRSVSYTYPATLVTVMMTSFFVVGVGSSKKLAKRHAAENLLATMKAQGMDIKTAVTEPKAKVIILY